MPHWESVSQNKQIKRTKKGKKKTYTALERTPVDVVTVELTDGHGSILMRVHLDKSETPISLHTGLDDIAKVLEQRNEVVLGGVRGEVANITCRLPLGSLVDNHVVTLNTVGREMVMTEGVGRHAHGCHGLLL